MPQRLDRPEAGGGVAKEADAVAERGARVASRDDCARSNGRACIADDAHELGAAAFDGADASLPIALRHASPRFFSREASTECNRLRHALQCASWGEDHMTGQP